MDVKNDPRNSKRIASQVAQEGTIAMTGEREFRHCEGVARGNLFTLVVLVLCPVLCLAAFIVPMRVLCVAGVAAAVAYVVCLRPRPASMVRTLIPAAVYFAALLVAGAIQQVVALITGAPSLRAAGEAISAYEGIASGARKWAEIAISSTEQVRGRMLMMVRGAARTSLAIAVSSLLSTAAYTVTTDLERREALTYAEEKIRHFLRMRPALALAPALSLLSSFIPMAWRVWSEVDEARRARGMTIVHPAVLVAFISVCMQKAVETGEVIRARE